jgi:transcriptional regulator with XRE-family HTH domain
LIEVRRRQRGLSRAVVAELVGRSEEWLRQVERGSRRLDSIEAMVRLAEVLHVEDMRALVDWPFRPTGPSEDADAMTVEVRRALLASAPGLVDAPAPGPIGQVNAEVDDLWRVWNGSRRRYTRVARRLPALLVEAARRETPEATAEAYCAVHRLAAALLARLGDHHLAWLAADRAFARVADRHAALAAVSNGQVGECLLGLGHHDEALSVLLRAVERLGHPGDAAGTTVFGSLCLLAAMCAAAQQDRRRAESLATAAAEAAAAIGTDRMEHHVWFGPTAVAMAGVVIALRLGRTNEALRRAAELDIPDMVPASWRAPYLIVLADAYAHRRDDIAAVFALTRVERACVDDIRHDRGAHRTLSLLFRRNNQLVRRELTRLSRTAGIIE